VPASPRPPACAPPPAAPSNGHALASFWEVYLVTASQGDTSIKVKNRDKNQKQKQSQKKNKRNRQRRGPLAIRKALLLGEDFAGQAAQGARLQGVGVAAPGVDRDRHVALVGGGRFAKVHALDAQFKGALEAAEFDHLGAADDGGGTTGESGAAGAADAVDEILG
jgi:hypothetical protein